MELTPEERRKIYEEEKARIEAEQQAPLIPGKPPQESTVNIDPKVAGLLCYLGAWITGIIFLVIEQKNQWIRFHAAQSIVVFASLFLAGMILGWIPFIGPAFGTLIGILGFVLWIVLMIKAYNGERFKVAVAGDIAEKMVASPAFTPEPKPAREQTASDKSDDTNAPPAGTADAAETAAEPSQSASQKSRSLDELEANLEDKIDRKVKEYLENNPAASVVGSAFAIAWCTVLLVFFNFFNEYIAYYSSSTPGDVLTWSRYPLLTGDFSQWLPVVNAALIAAIIGNILIIVFNRRLLSSVISFIIDCFSIVAVISLLVIYPFDFSVLPNDTATTWTGISVTVTLILISVGIFISLLVRLIKGLIFIGRGSGTRT